MSFAYRGWITLPLVLLFGANAPARHDARAEVEPVFPNDNRQTSGRLHDGVLTLELDARAGVWYPEGPGGTAYHVAAFGETGRPLQNPGPVIRVPEGTEVRVTVRNTLAEPLTMFGLGRTRGVV
ncbi:MAG: hypothetical protein ACREK1_13140, partial [Longimicrobiales bacterium]